MYTKCAPKFQIINRRTFTALWFFYDYITLHKTKLYMIFHLLQLFLKTIYTLLQQKKIIRISSNESPLSLVPHHLHVSRGTDMYAERSSATLTEVPYMSMSFVHTGHIFLQYNLHLWKSQKRIEVEIYSLWVSFRLLQQFHPSLDVAHISTFQEVSAGFYPQTNELLESYFYNH